MKKLDQLLEQLRSSVADSMTVIPESGGYPIGVYINWVARHGRTHEIKRAASYSMDTNPEEENFDRRAWKEFRDALAKVGEMMMDENSAKMAREIKKAEDEAIGLYKRLRPGHGLSKKPLSRW